MTFDERRFMFCSNPPSCEQEFTFAVPLKDSTSVLSFSTFCSLAESGGVLSDEMKLNLVATCIRAADHFVKCGHDAPTILTERGPENTSCKAKRGSADSSSSITSSQCTGNSDPPQHNVPVNQGEKNIQGDKAIAGGDGESEENEIIKDDGDDGHDRRGGAPFGSCGLHLLLEEPQKDHKVSVSMIHKIQTAMACVCRVFKVVSKHGDQNNN